MAENFPNLKKETAIQVQEAQRVPYKVNPNRPTPRHIIIKMAKVKDKEDLQDSKGKTKSHLQGNPHKANSQFYYRNFAGQKGVTWYIQSTKREKPAT